MLPRTLHFIGVSNHRAIPVSVSNVSYPLSEAKNRGTARALVAAVRPRQWVKNGLVVVAPLAAGADHYHAIRQTIVAFVCFCLAASSVYLFNDFRDIESDRHHPTKRFRPIAAGELSPQLALSSAVVLAAASVALALLVPQTGGLFAVLLVYLAISVSYALGVKSIPIIELAAVASGFFLRAYAGAVASNLFVSTWFLVVISFGALFLVLGKRTAEKKTPGLDPTIYRYVLTQYTPEFLRSALVMTSSVVVTGYCLWAFDTTTTGLSFHHHYITPIRLTVVPVVLVILHILRLLESGEGASPEDLVLTDRTVQCLGLVWAALFIIGVYA